MFMYLLRCELTLHDTLFFATREMGTFYETERYIHNYAMSYALFGDSLIRRPFFCDSYTPAYAQDLGILNNAAVYVTPAQPLTWDYILVTWKIGQVNYYRRSEKFGDSKQNYPANIGRAKELVPESTFEFYVLTKEPISLPRWIRLGKWMSKALVEVKEIQEIESQRRQGSFFAVCTLNPLDIPSGTLEVCDIVSMPPSSLITNARMEGYYYELGKLGRGLPADMRFTIPELPANKTLRNRRK
jgi:CRISPR-associated protein Csc1